MVREEEDEIVGRMGKMIDIILEMVVTEMYLQPPKMVLFVLNVVVTDEAN